MTQLSLSRVILDAVNGAIREGLEERKAEKTETESAEAAEPKKERRTRSAKKSKPEAATEE